MMPDTIISKLRRQQNIAHHPADSMVAAVSDFLKIGDAVANLLP